MSEKKQIKNEKLKQVNGGKNTEHIDDSIPYINSSSPVPNRVIGNENTFLPLSDGLHPDNSENQSDK